MESSSTKNLTSEKENLIKEDSNNVINLNPYVSKTDIMMSHEIDKLFAAMSKAQGEMSGAIANRENPFYQSNYADLHSVIECSRKALMNYGLSVIQVTQLNPDTNRLSLLTILGHSSGQWILGKTPILCDMKSPQVFGSAMAYARRYAWAAICGTATMDDDAEIAMDSLQPAERIKMNNKQVNKFIEDVRSCLSKGDDKGLQELWAEWSSEEKIVLWGRFNSQERRAMKELEKNG